MPPKSGTNIAMGLTADLELMRYQNVGVDTKNGTKWGPCDDAPKPAGCPEGNTSVIEYLLINEYIFASTGRPLLLIYQFCGDICCFPPSRPILITVPLIVCVRVFVCMCSSYRRTSTVSWPHFIRNLDKYNHWIVIIACKPVGAN